MDVFVDINSLDHGSRNQPFASSSIDPKWSPDALQRRLKLESNLNVSGVVSTLDDQLNFPNKKSVRDPLSHRIIEKKRRDRMNNCLANLSSLLPSFYLKKSRGRVEKTEIIEMAITHLKYLQMQHKFNKKTDNSNETNGELDLNDSSLDSFYLGYQECMSQVTQFLAEVDGFYAGDNVCVHLLNHLKKHYEDINKHYNTQSSVKMENKNIKIKQEINHPTDVTMQEENNCVIKDKSPEIPVKPTTNKLVSSATKAKIKSDDNNDNNNHNNNNKNEEIYKYKTTIKQRFNADLQYHQPKCNSNHSDSDKTTTTIAHSLNPLTPSMSPNLLPTVPLFVLHPRGNFYIPLVIDTRVVAPFFESFKNSHPTLHPINITVCFAPNPGELESHEIKWMRPCQFTDHDSILQHCAQQNKNERTKYENYNVIK